MISQVHQSLSGLTGTATEPTVEAQKPAVNPKKSVQDDFIICLEDGRKFKSLKRHLMTHFSLSPDEYRAKWNLPSDYPMVAPAYAAARSAPAKSMGLGRKHKETAPAPALKNQASRKAKAAA